MTEHPNAAIVREGFEAFKTGNMAWLDEHLADDVVWHVGGKSVLSGDHRGKQAVLELFGRQARLFDGPPRIDVHDVIANDEHAVAIGAASVDDPDGGIVEWKFANIFHVADGKATEVWGLADETSASDAVIDKRLS